MAKKARRSTLEEKLAAVRMLQLGSDANQVAEAFEVSRAIVYRWLQKYKNDGEAALEVKKAPGRIPSLTIEQRGKIFSLIEGSNPRQMQLDFGELWTRKNVQAMIRRCQRTPCGGLPTSCVVVTSRRISAARSMTLPT